MKKRFAIVNVLTGRHFTNNHVLWWSESVWDSYLYNSEEQIDALLENVEILKGPGKPFENIKLVKTETIYIL